MNKYNKYIKIKRNLYNKLFYYFIKSLFCYKNLAFLFFLLLLAN